MWTLTLQDSIDYRLVGIRRLGAGLRATLQLANQSVLPRTARAFEGSFGLTVGAAGLPVQLEPTTTHAPVVHRVTIDLALTNCAQAAFLVQQTDPLRDRAPVDPVPPAVRKGLSSETTDFFLSNGRIGLSLEVDGDGEAGYVSLDVTDVLRPALVTLTARIC